MKQYEGRYISLANRLNSHLFKLTQIKKNYCSLLNGDDLLELKFALSDINNMLTLKMSISAINWLSKYFKVSVTEKAIILDKVDQMKPNQNGFDIMITCPYKIIGEVKCILPVRNGVRFGAAQKNAILADVKKLKLGTSRTPDTKDFFKFLFLIDLGYRTDQAILALLKVEKTRVVNEIRKMRNEMRPHILVWNEAIKLSSLSTDIVYFKKLSIDEKNSGYNQSSPSTNRRR